MKVLPLSEVKTGMHGVAYTVFEGVKPMLQAVARNVFYVGRTNELADRFRFDGSIPITLVFDASGRELFRNEGVIDAVKFRRKLDDLIKRRKR